MFGSDN